MVLPLGFTVSEQCISSTVGNTDFLRVPGLRNFGTGRTPDKVDVMNTDPSSAPRWLSPEEQNLWRLLLATVRKANRCIEETLFTGNGLSTSEFAVLVSLSENPERQMRLRDLCIDLDWDRSRASHQITRMERRGLVRKTRCAGDARGVVVQITPEGAESLDAAVPRHVESVQRLIFDVIDPDDIPALNRFLRAVLAVDNVPGANGFDPGEHAFPDAGNGVPERPVTDSAGSGKSGEDRGNP